MDGRGDHAQKTVDEVGRYESLLYGNATICLLDARIGNSGCGW
jgi:hypothetical protein